MELIFCIAEKQLSAIKRLLQAQLIFVINAVVSNAKPPYFPLLFYHTFVKTGLSTYTVVHIDEKV